MYSHTRVTLEQFDNPHDFERMCADILNALGYKEVVLMAPRGGSDGGKDITFTTESGGKGLACVTLRKDIETKFSEDFSQRQPGEFEKYMLFCTVYLTAPQKLKFVGYCLDHFQALLIPMDIETLRSLLDSVLKQIRETYLHIKDETREMDEERLEKLREEMQRQSQSQLLLFEADKYPSPFGLMDREKLVKEAVKLWPDFKQREYRQLGILMSRAVIQGVDPSKSVSQLAQKVSLRKVERTWLATSAINYLEETVLNTATPDTDGLLYLACMYGYQQRFQEMMKIIRKAINIDEGMKGEFQEWGILLTLLRACGSDQTKMESVRKTLGIPLITKTSFSTFIKGFDLEGFSSYIEYIAMKRPDAPGERGIFLIKITPPYEVNKRLVSADAQNVDSWQFERVVSNIEQVSIPELYNALCSRFVLIYPLQKV
jgi:hypothetical protein